MEDVEEDRDGSYHYKRLRSLDVKDFETYNEGGCLSERDRY